MSPAPTAPELTPALLIDSSPILKAVVQLIRANDAYGTYRNWADELLLKPYIVTKANKKDISLEEAIDPLTKSRILAFYRAIAYCIEQETGSLAQVVIDLNHEGFGWALVFAGRLLLVSKTLRDAQRFGFKSLEKMNDEGTKLVEKGIELAKQYPEVGEL
jgi:probable nitrogen fixation protein